ncbi:major facilitator superfamily domain-containing protein [Clohesyomyces aquaticus]|uniref:Major facilitator superfamily domain-containing protein n=1 Tax=Clohesyomyces aquaticus TaxID=1231657 RepID=A0A1Y2A7V1_9PLEO|nr:major facilitator superfamily domain-containing protein [Clohesyomyces aquaticus]
MTLTSSEQTHRKTRIVSVVAATAISLACGTNYAYSAWAPQFAEKLQLSATQSNVIGTAANIGMYASGIPMGLITDRKSPRLAAVIGMFALAVGYFPIHTAFEKGAGSMSVALISFCSFLTGVGSCAAFQAALKTVISGLAFPGNTEDYLLLLSLGTSLLVLVSIPFLQVVDHGSTYSVLPTSERSRRGSTLLHRTKSNGSKHSNPSVPNQEPADNDEQDGSADETSSLMSAPGDIAPENDAATTHSPAHHHSHYADVTGLALLSRIEFWHLWTILGLLTGVGLMTINNIGHDVQALWSHYDDSVSKSFVADRQLMHVSIISLSSFLGRLLSGIGSDLIVKKLHGSRFWCAALSASVFSLAQILALRIENPHFLYLVSGLCGLAYGVLFGVFPTLVADAFGPKGFAVNWGFMTLAPVVSGNIYNLCYGAIYDKHSDVRDGERKCDEGLGCYRDAYWVTFVSSVMGILACLWGIRHEQMVKRRLREEEECEGHRDA